MSEINVLSRLRIIFANGNSWLRDYEAEAFRRFVDKLSIGERKKAVNQIKHLNLVQRSPDGKILMFFHCGDDERATFNSYDKLLMNKKDENKHRFEFNMSDGRKITGVIFITQGWISSMECKLRPKSYVKKSIKIFDLGAELDIATQDR